MYHPLAIAYTPLPQGSIDELRIWRRAFEAALAPWLDGQQQKHVCRFGLAAVQAQTGTAQNLVGQEVMEAALSRLLARAQLITAAAWYPPHALPQAVKNGPSPIMRMDNRGRPLLAGWHAAFSHSGRAAFCALAPAGNAATSGLGLDAEAITSPPPHASAFAAAELAAPPTLPQKHAHRDALRRWTIKEALLKAAGLGLGMQPAHIPTGNFGQRAGLWAGPLGPIGWRSVASPGHWLCVAQAGHVPSTQIFLLRQSPRTLLHCLADLQPRP